MTKRVSTLRLYCNLVITFYCKYPIWRITYSLRSEAPFLCFGVFLCFCYSCCILGLCVVYECILSTSAVFTLLSCHIVRIVSGVHREIVHEGYG